MNIVLLGFNEKDANAITILCNMLAKEIYCSYIPIDDPQFVQNELQRQPFDIAMIFIDSIQHQLAIKRSLFEYIEYRPVILISRYLEDLRVEPWSSLNAQAHLQYPYTRQAMIEPLKKVHQLHLSGQLQNVEPTLNSNVVITNPNQLPNNNYNAEIIKTKYPELAIKRWAIQFLNLPHQKQCAELMIGPYQFLVNPTEKSLISLRTLQWTLDYLRVSYDEGLNISMDSKMMECNQAALFGEQMLNNNGTKQSLPMSLWQLAMVWLEQMPNLDIKAIYQTPFKVHAIPNLSELSLPDTHLHGIFSACLVQARTLEQLVILFPQIDPIYLHRIILASVLANIGTFQTATESKNTSNKGINQANKTGFFQRLLSKLGFKTQ